MADILLRLCDDDEVIGKADQDTEVAVVLLPVAVQHVEVDVGEERADGSALCGARFGLYHVAILHHTCLQPQPDEFRHPPVAYPLLHQLQELLVVDVVEVSFDNRVQHPPAFVVAFLPDDLQRLMLVPFGPKPEGAVPEVRLEDGFHDDFRRGLDHLVLYGKQSERPLLSVLLGDRCASQAWACSRHLQAFL